MIAAVYTRKSTEQTGVADEQKWRQVLVEDPTNARPIVLGLLKDRVSFKPVEAKRWMASGEGHLTGLFQKVLFPSVWRPQGEPWKGGSLKFEGIAA
jgi:hypothetical protein